MKHVTKLLGAGLLASLATSAFALTIPAGWNSTTGDFRITGATAFRAAVNAAIPTVITVTDAANNGSGQGIWVGKLKSDNTTVVVIRTSFTGSIAGVDALVNSTPVSFLKTTATNASLVTENLTANAAFSDASQASAALVQGNLASPSLSDTAAGVIVFRWVASPGSGLTNATNYALVASLNAVGKVGLFTGADLSTAPGNVPVYVIGRDKSSGTRVSAFSVTGFGVASTPLQFSVTAGVADLFNGTGESGYSSGGLVATAVATANPLSLTFNAGNPGYFVGYLGEADATTAIGLGAVPLTYNGVAYSRANTAHGAYGFWAVEHLFDKGSLSGGAATAKTDLLAKLPAAIVTADAGVPIGDMQVDRANEASAPIPNI